MDIILYNGKIRLLDLAGTIVQAAGIKGNRILCIGSDRVILGKKTDNTKLIDLKGKLVLPGFNDSHLHLIGYGLSKKILNVNNASSIEEIVTEGKRYIMDHNIPEGEWIRGRGWNQENFSTGAFPEKRDLDRISKKHPVCLTRVCGHTAVVNTAALQLYQSENSRGPNPDINPETGSFSESALSSLYDIFPSPSPDEIKTAITNACADLIKAGITSVQTDDFYSIPGHDFRKVTVAYKELSESKKLPLRVYQQCLLPEVEELKEFLNEGRRTGDGDEYYRTGPLKLLLDGSLGARTALLDYPYADDASSSGTAVYTEKELDDIVRIAHNNGMQIAIHAIGGRAIGMALDSLKKADRKNGRPDPRHGIIHCQITDESLVKRFAEENIIAYIQPVFIDSDLHIVETRIGKDKAAGAYIWKTMLRSGVKTAGGSDAPVASINVLENIYCAVTRKDLSGFPAEGWHPEQKLTVDEAVRLFTADSAYTSFEEDIKGTIEPGKLADMIVLSEDIYYIDPDRIGEVKILLTMMDGKIRYSKMEDY